MISKYSIINYDTTDVTALLDYPIEFQLSVQGVSKVQFGLA